MWTIPHAQAYGDPPMDATGSPGGRLFARQPSAGWAQTGTDAAGVPVWTLDAPAAGVLLVSMATLPVSITLPGGFTVELALELVPVANRLDVSYRIVMTTIQEPWWDRCHVLRIRRNGAVVAEARRQHEILGPSWSSSESLSRDASRLTLQAGFCLDATGALAVAALAFDTPAPMGLDRLTLESTPSIPGPDLLGTRLATPFGRGMVLQVPATGVSVPAGTIQCTAPAVTGAPAPPCPARAWFAHAAPLEERLPLRPDGIDITARPRERLAWGRSRAQVLAGPPGWGLGPLEAEGHPEWVLIEDDLYRPAVWTHHPGASRLHDLGRPAVLVADGTSSVATTNEGNTLLAGITARWQDADGWTTDTMPMGTLLGALNEYRPAGWTARPQTWTPPGAGEPGRSTQGVYLAVAIQRTSATNLGSIAAQADAVEVRRIVVRWLALCRATYNVAGGGTDTEYRRRAGAVVLSADDAFALLAGQSVAIADGYVQGLYPTPAAASIPGTLTVRAVGPV